MNDKATIYLINEIGRLELTIFNLQKENEALKAENRLIKAKGSEKNGTTEKSDAEHRQK